MRLYGPFNDPAALGRARTDVRDLANKHGLQVVLKAIARELFAEADDNDDDGCLLAASDLRNAAATVDMAFGVVVGMERAQA